MRKRTQGLRDEADVEAQVGTAQARRPLHAGVSICEAGEYQSRILTDQSMKPLLTMAPVIALDGVLALLAAIVTGIVMKTRCNVLMPIPFPDNLPDALRSRGALRCRCTWAPCAATTYRRKPSEL